MSESKRKRRLVRWYALPEAAEALALSTDALRKQLERRARRAPDGGTEADIDSIRGRKFGRLWRVSFGERWTA